MEEGKWGWLEYVNHHSEEWREEYSCYCQENGITVNNESVAGAVVTSEVAHGLMHHRHAPEIYGERFGGPPRPYFKPGVDSPMDVAARNFEAQMNAVASDMRMRR